jgi:multiple RNA-binding domain-containing protein 1
VETKRKRDVVEDGDKVAAIKELTGSKRKNKLLAQNPDLERAQNAPAPENVEITISEKSKKRKAESEDKTPRKRVQVVETPSVVEVVYDDSAPQDPDAEMEDAKETAPTPATDVDWLRARTSRTLGLVSDSEDSDNEKDPQAKDEASVVSEDEEPDYTDTNQTPVTPPATDPSGTEQPTKSTTADSKILNTGRLFLRNLVYGVTEDDLRTIFAPYGELEEVLSPP